MTGQNEGSVQDTGVTAPAEIRQDFSSVVPGRRVAVICGEEVDVTRVPARVTLAMFAKIQEKRRNNGQFEIDDLAEIVSMVCTRSNPKVTKDWLLDNAEIAELVKFSDFVLEPMSRFFKGEDTGEAAENAANP